MQVTSRNQGRYPHGGQKRAEKPGTRPWIPRSFCLSLRKACPDSPDDLYAKDYEEVMAYYDGSSGSGALVSG